MGYWQNKVVLVTGGSLGLGRVIAEVLARHGARVVICARGKDALDAVAGPLRKEGYEVASFVADLTNDAETDQLLSQIRQRFGRLDALINCAGRSSRGAILETTPADFQALWEVNFLATVRCIRAAAPLLIETGGHVVNLASLAAKVAPRYMGAYPASKFPLVAYSQQLRLELGPEGLHVLLVCPGPIARDDLANRYEHLTADLPESARQPAGGAKLKAIDPQRLAEKILKACQRRQNELIVPAKARCLFVVSQISARLGDWLLRRRSG